MNQVALAYYFPVNCPDDFGPSIKRWAETLTQFNPGFGHDLHLFYSNGDFSQNHVEMFRGLEYEPHPCPGDGWDIGAYQFAAQSLAAYPLVVMMNTRVHFNRAGWLARLMVARGQHFDENGLYGLSSSYERSPFTEMKRSEHIRTACFATNPKTFSRYPHKIDSRVKGFLCESGVWNLSHWYADAGYLVVMVTWDGVYSKDDWRKPSNIFRRGDQSNLLVCDRHTDLYLKASPGERVSLERCADGFI